MKDYLVRVYWGDRNESVEDCADRISNLMVCLAGCHEQLTDWKESVSPGHRGPIPVIKPRDRDTLVEILLRGRNRTDFGGDVMPELGYVVQFFTEPGPSGFGLLARVGAHGAGGRRIAANEVMIDLPWHAEAVSMGLLNPEFMEATLSCLVRVFTPMWGMAYSIHWTRGYIQPLSVGWLTYLPTSTSSLPPLPAGTQIMEANPTGSMIALPIDREAPDSDEVQDLAERVLQTLLVAGLVPTSADR